MVLSTHPSAPNGHQVVPLWYNGAAQPFSDKDTLFPVNSSVKGKPIHYAVSSSAEAATAACDSAAAAFKSWRNTTPTHRRDLLFKAIDIIGSRREKIAASQVAETSCPQGFADANSRLGIVTAKEVAAATTELRGTVPQRMGGPDGQQLSGLTIVVREPIGVVLIIPP